MKPRIRSFRRRQAAACAFVCGALAGCAGTALETANEVDSREIAASPSRRSADTNAPMDQHRLEQIFADEVEAITGPVGVLQSEVRGIPVYLFSDEVHDRMRLFAAIARTKDIDPALHAVLLTANFHSTLDARYALSNGFVFSVFMHPISSLSPELVRSALSQVVALVENFGSSYSSGVLSFPADGNGR